MHSSDWVLLGGEPLLTREISDLIEERKLPITLHLAGPAGSKPVLDFNDEDATVVEPLSDVLLEGSDVLLLGGDAVTSREALAMLGSLKRKPAVIDLDGIFEDLPQSVVRAPLWEEPDRPADSAGAIHTLAHPAAVALARLVAALSGAGKLARVVATVYEPASEHGQAGVDELHSQTMNLFNFQPLPQSIYDTQVSFTLLPRFGPDSRVNLERNQRRMERHLATMLGSRALPLASLRLLHAPVFHAYTLSLWAEFDQAPGMDAVRGALEAQGAELSGDDVAPVSNTSVAGQSGLTLSDVSEDQANPRSVWLWAAFDNVRARAEAAVLTGGLLARGKADE